MRTSLALLVAVIAACSSCASSHGSDGNGANGGGTPGGDAGASNAAPTGPVVAEASIGPIAVAAGEEKTVCIVKHLGNADDLVVSSISVNLAPGSHHLILYRTDATTENLTPTPCSPFQGIGSTNLAPLVFGNREQLSWTFPSGVGLPVPKNQMVRIEAHYINPSSSPITAQGTVTFQGTPQASAPPWQPADTAFYGTINIDIPPHAKLSTGPRFQAGMPGTHFISVTTHQHRLGTRAQVWASKAEGDLSRPLADDQDWAEPSWHAVDPVFDFDGTSGLTYQCDWNNVTDQTVHFGESALDEMCFVGGYFWPAHAIDICIDGKCRNR